MKAFRTAADAGARLLRRGARALERAADSRTMAIERGMASHDMDAHPDERYYADQYWHWLAPQLPALGEAPRTVDIGCGQGRLALRVAAARPAGRVLGLDLSPAAIDAARAKAVARGLRNVEFHTGDAAAFLANLESAAFDLVLLTEVTFFMASFRDVLSAARRLLRPGGVFFGAFRSQYFNVLHSVRDRDWRSAQLVVEAREGEWAGGATWFTWQTPEDVHELLSHAGLTPTEPLRGVGVCSGIEGDPLAGIAQPSRLPDQEQARLMAVELALAQRYAACGRYIVAVATR